MLYISGLACVVDDKTCTLDAWHNLCACHLTKCVLMMNLFMWYMSSVARVLNHTTIPRATKKVHTRLRLYMQTVYMCVLTHAWKFKLP